MPHIWVKTRLFNLDTLFLVGISKGSRGIPSEDGIPDFSGVFYGFLICDFCILGEKFFKKKQC